MKPKPKVLFIARRYPPSVGGMQQFAYQLAESLKEKTSRFDTITWGGSNFWLPIIVPWLFIRAMYMLASVRDYDLLHIQDAALSPLGWLLHILSGKPYLVIAHGLDITYANPLYRPVRWFVRRASAVISISQATADEAIKLGVSLERSLVITPGINDMTAGVKVDKNQLGKEIGFELNSSNVLLLTVGRLVKRKGVAWFVDNVLHGMVERHPNVLYLVAGDGAERNNIELAISNSAMHKNVVLLGKVSDEIKSHLYKACDIFIMPNIVVPGDMEGFGLVAQEAAAAGLPVVASNLEGIADALQNGKNATLIKSGNAEGFSTDLERLLDNDNARVAMGKAARDYTLKNFGWSEVAKRYIDVYKKILTQED